MGDVMRPFRIPAALLALLALLAAAPLAHAQQSADPRVADLVKAGQIRVGLHSLQYKKDAASGELKGPWIEVYRDLAARMGVKLVFLEYPSPPKMAECLDKAECDIASLGFDPTRAALVGGFTPAFMRMEYTLLVTAGSGINSVADADRPGRRIAVVRGHASTLTLGRILKHAEQVAVDVPEKAFDLIEAGKVDAWASIRPTLAEHAAKLAGARVLDESYGANAPALVVPKGQAARLSYLTEFVEQSKASGAIQRALERAGERGFVVPPPDTPRH
jgi:polar amino acid transport system substrate-binding protein